MDAPARVRVAHFAVDAPAVDVFVNGEAVLEGVPYPAMSDFLSLEAGSYDIAVAPDWGGPRRGRDWPGQPRIHRRA